MSSLMNSYLVGMLVGTFVGGMLLGSIPMIILFIKKRWGLGIAAPVFSGVFGLLNAYLAWGVAIVCLLISIFIKPNWNTRPFVSEQTQSATNNKNLNPMYRPSAPMPTNPGTNHIPAWKRVQMEKEVAQKQENVQ